LALHDFPRPKGSYFVLTIRIGDQLARP
jgi:hypothetical protein